MGRHGPCGREGLQMGVAGVIQTSFNSGEWAPNLYGRVDLDSVSQRRGTAAKLLRRLPRRCSDGAGWYAVHPQAKKGGGAGNVRLIASSLIPRQLCAGVW